MSRIYEALISRLTHFSLSHGAPYLAGAGNLDEQIVALLEDSREDFEKGFPSFGIPPLEPLILDSFHTYIYQKAIIKADVYLDNISISGLKDFIIESFNFKIVGLTVTFVFTIPQLTLNSKYRVDGKAASIVPFKPHGEAHGEASEITVKGTATLGTRDGYLYIKTFTTAFDLEKTKVSLTGMLGNGMFNSLFNWILTRISDKVVQEQKDRIAETASDIILDIANELLKEVKLTDLIG